MNRYTINDNCQIELYFDNKPDNRIRNVLKSLDWHFNHDLQCWVSQPTNKAILTVIALSQEETFLKTSKDIRAKIETLQNSISLDYETDISVVDSMQGHTFHNYSECNARIKICDKKGILTTLVQPVFYCKTCQHYYISPENYEKLCAHGAPLAAFYSKNKGIDSLRDESPLKLLGYSVSQKDALNPKERQRILKYILDEKIMPKPRIIAYLEWYIRSHPSDIYEISRRRWADDIEYVQGL